MLNEDPDLSVVDMQGKINTFLITTFPLHLDSFFFWSKIRNRLQISLLILSELHTFFYKQHFYGFISNARLKLAKNQANAKQHPGVKLLTFEF